MRTEREWGYFTVIDEGPGFKVKRLVVAPGKSLSRQTHYHRHEVWAVVSGAAKVEKDDVTLKIGTGSHVGIPAGIVHRLGNIGMIPLQVIEVQTGEYLEDDDIVRLSAGDLPV